MKAATRQTLPLIPLLRAYTAAGVPDPGALGRLPVLGPRFAAVLNGRATLLAESFVDGARDAEFQTALLRFYEAAVPQPLHADQVRRRAGVVRHALGHLLRGADPLPRKVDRCLGRGGAYRVAGLGPAFWSALFQCLDPANHPAWTPATDAGLARLGLGDRPDVADAGRAYAARLEVYRDIRAHEPGLTALHVDHFLTLVAAMGGRELWAGADAVAAALTGRVDVAAVVHQERRRVPLRRRLKEHGRRFGQATHALEEGLRTRDGLALSAALSAAGVPDALLDAVDWAGQGELLTLWLGRLWEADDPYEVLADFWQTTPVAGAGLWLPAAVLHLKSPQAFAPWDEQVRHGFAALEDDADRAEPPAERYRLFNEGVARFRERHQLHPLEMAAVLGALADARGRTATEAERGRFGGFCTDTFRFLGELAGHNTRAWMDGQRERYRFTVRGPMLELCRALAERYVEPVLRRRHGWDVETAACSGRALTSICKNNYGRSAPYHADVWITFFLRHPAGDAAALPPDREAAGKRQDVQLFVRLGAEGVRYGLRLGAEARSAGRLFRANLEQHAALVHRALARRHAFQECGFGHGDAEPGQPLTSLDDFRAWTAGRCLVVGKERPAGSPHLLSDDLVGDILLTFDRLLPLFACAAEPDPLPLLRRLAGATSVPGYSELDFCAATFLDAAWLRRALTLLDLKRQLILQGVPGTGKTHVARCLARLLTDGRDAAVRLVQFHPAYSYEEFVEGIKVRSVEADGRHDVTYPVEDGLLCAFAAEAARRPHEPHALIIDEINRGNLPRVFGELLYLLEYREQAVELPYSRRRFRLPANLYVIGTMNAADRSVALVDQALRRRFSFLDMVPDPAVLAAWYAAHPPAGPAEFAGRVVGLLERLNARLRGDAGPHCQVGHSYLMVPDLDRPRLEAVWQHQVRPLLDEYFAGQPGRAASYDLADLLADRPASGDRRRARAGVEE